MPEYKYISKINRAPAGALDFEPGTTVQVADDRNVDGHTILTNGTKLNADYVEYYAARYPQAVWQQTESAYDPVQLRERGELVAVIMPLGV